MIGRLAVVAALCVAPSLAHAHGLEPALLSLREVAAGRFEVVWKSSKLRLPGAEVRPILPTTCERTDAPPQVLDDGDRVRLSWTIDCRPGGIAGQTLGVADLDVAKIDALLRVDQLDDTGVQTILTARQPTWTAPADPTPRQMLWHFARLGAGHLLGSPESLLFVGGLLLLLAPVPRLLFQAVAALAIGYSLTLALIAAGAIEVPRGAVELLVPAGLLLLAVELAGGAEPRRHRHRATWLMAFGFGLLAGCALAGDLTAAGLPTGAAPLATLAFNLGIEAALLAVLAALLAAGTLIARGLPAATHIATRVAAYGIGILAACWCFERLAA